VVSHLGRVACGSTCLLTVRVTAVATRRGPLGLLHDAVSQRPSSRKRSPRFQQQYQPRDVSLRSPRTSRAKNFRLPTGFLCCVVGAPHYNYVVALFGLLARL
jgi:hypothetical protein